MSMFDASKPFQVWWVNQGHTYAKAKADGYLWAPIPVEGGKSFPHWDSMTQVQAGDIIINYGHKSIVALSIARSSAVRHPNRKKEGWRVDVEYHDLLQPIDLEEFKAYLDEMRTSIDTNPPFDEIKNVLQGYLFNFSHTGLFILTRLFGERLPESILGYLGMGSEISFSKYCHDQGFVFDADLINRYVLSLKTKPFVILSGKSGTGKTKLAQLFAQYMDEQIRQQRKPSSESDLLSRRWFKLSFNDKLIVNAFEGSGKKINLVRKTILKDGIMSLVGLDSKKNIDMNQKKMMKDLQEGDVIIAYQGGYTVGGIGVVTQSHFFDDAGDAFDSFYESTKNFIRVDWKFDGPLKINDFYMEDNRIPAFSMWSDTIHQLNEEQIRRFSDYLSNKDIVLDATGIQEIAKSYEIIPVGHGWTDSSPLLGYYNSLNEDYQMTPALSLILNAVSAVEKGQDSIFFLILDGMNTSQPDHYLAELISAMESGEPVSLHHSNEVELETGIPKDVVLPPNLCVVGTLHDGAGLPTLPPVVLDRANVIELPSPSGSSYSFYHSALPCFSKEPTIQPLFRMGALAQSHIFEKMAGIRIPDDVLPDFHKRIATEMELFQTILGNMGCPFGFRVIQDMMMYMYLSWEIDRQPMIWNDWYQALDIQILQQILPTIHGSEKRIGPNLRALYGCCFGEISDEQRLGMASGVTTVNMETLDFDGARYKRSARKLWAMYNELELQGFVSFFS